MAGLYLPQSYRILHCTGNNGPELYLSFQGATSPGESGLAPSARASQCLATSLILFYLQTTDGERLVSFRLASYSMVPQVYVHKVCLGLS